MKIGLVSAILADYSFEKMIDTASDMGFECVEVACWPTGTAERRYAGVSHINVDMLDEKKKRYILDYCRNRKIEISALAFYPNTLDGDMKKRAANIEHLKKVIRAAAFLGVNMVTTFIGRDQKLSVEDNLKEVKKEWPSILELAQTLNVKIAIENCPMLFDRNQWPGGHNLMTTPAIWRKVFELLDSPALGLNFDPSHFVWQMLDYIAPIYEFRDKIFHVHFKDIKVFQEKLKNCGTMAYPLDYMSPKIPGLGDVDWGKYCSALSDIGYTGYACIEIEDKAFESSEESILTSIRQAKKYLSQYTG